MDNSALASVSRSVTSVNITGVRRIEALGPHLQPYPGINLRFERATIKNYRYSK